jgi:hypothetical protein
MAEPSPDGATDGLFARDSATAAAEMAVDRLTRAAGNRDLTMIAAGIDALLRVLAVATVDRELRRKYLPVLAGAYYSRYELAGDIKDLRAAIERGQQAAAVIPAEHPSHRATWYLLAESHMRAFDRSGAADDLGRCIEAGQRALDGTDDSARGVDRRTRAATLALTGNAYWLRFQRNNAPDDLTASITLGEQALKLGDAGYHLLVGIATAVMTRSQQSRDPVMLRRGIDLLDKALTSPTAAKAENRSIALWTIATNYLHMYEHSKRIEDLERCEARTREALGSARIRSSDRSMLGVHVADLTTALMSLETPDAMDRAIELGRIAADLLAARHPYRMVVYANLSLAHRYRFEQSGTPHEIEVAVTLAERAFRRTRTDGAGHLMARAQVMQNLSLCYRRRFELRGNKADQRRADTFAVRAARLLTELLSGPVKPSFLGWIRKFVWRYRAGPRR